MEIERKFLIKELPANLDEYPCLFIEQAYLNTNPVIRIRRQDEEYYLTYKGKGLMSREEYNLPLNKEAYEHLRPKADGNIISKKRYVIPLENPGFKEGYTPSDTLADSENNQGLKIELDIFEEPFAPLILAEVEFPDEETAKAFLMPEWFKEDVTNNPAYHNSNLSQKTLFIKPLTVANIDDYFDFFDNRAFSDGSPYAPCYCNCFYLTPEEVKDTISQRAASLGGGMEGLKQALRESAESLIKAGTLRGYLAYEGNLAIGWCNANDRQNYIRVGSFNPGKRQETDYYISPGEAGKVKSVVCFEIAPEYRGKGIAKALLQYACEDAGRNGYEKIEVYPQITENFSSLDFTGPMEMYQNAGFKETGRHGKTIIMEKEL